MNDKNLSYMDRLWLAVCRFFAENKLPFVASLLAGFLTHGFALTNKLVNHDEIESLFGKGATITSGRWGLEAVKILFPDWSMPWIYGCISILLMSLAVCLAVKVLDIRSKPMQAILGMLVLSFPSLTGNFCFMFTSTAYALSFFLAVLSVHEFMKGGWLHLALSVLCLICGLSMYQAYISVSASIYVVLMILRGLDGKDWKENIIFGLRALAVMAVAIGVYYGITQLVFCVTGAEFNTYVTENVTGDVGIIRRVRMAYDAFFYIFSFRNFYIITSEASRYIHIVLAVFCFAAVALLALRKCRGIFNLAMPVALALLLPLSICCMYLIMSNESIHTLVMYSFVSVYMLLIALLERMNGKAGKLAGDVSALLLLAVLLSNVYFGNMTYLKLKLQYENAYAFYNSLITQVKQTEGFDEGTELAIIGYQDNLLHSFRELDTELLLGPAPDLVNIYSYENFIRYYLGFDVPFASPEEIEVLAQDERVQAMAEYPYYGSVGKVDEYVVVKLG